MALPPVALRTGQTKPYSSPKVTTVSSGGLATQQMNVMPQMSLSPQQVGVVAQQVAGGGQQLAAGTVGGAQQQKTLLQFSVTPPRPAGPSEAEMKIEALTRQLEEEMEKEEESEYFGNYYSGTACCSDRFVFTFCVHTLFDSFIFSSVYNTEHYDRLCAQ